MKREMNTDPISPLSTDEMREIATSLRRGAAGGLLDVLPLLSQAERLEVLAAHTDARLTADRLLGKDEPEGVLGRHFTEAELRQHLGDTHVPYKQFP